jgi:hypothetical protein
LRLPSLLTAATKIHCVCVSLSLSLSRRRHTTDPLYIHLPPYWKEYCKLRSIPYDPTDLILLLKSQYGSVDSAKLWCDKFVRILTEKGGCEMTKSKVDPCVLYNTASHRCCCNDGQQQAPTQLILLLSCHLLPIFLSRVFAHEVLFTSVHR